MSTPYAKSPIFDEQNLPDALRNDHRTKYSATIWVRGQRLSG